MFLSLKSLPGSEAAFSSDGSKVWVIPVFETEFLWEIDTTTWEAGRRPVRGFAAEETMQSLCLDEQGNLLVATDRALWTLAPGATEPRRLAALPKPSLIRGISCVTGKGPVPAGTVFLAVRPESEEDETLYLMRPDRKALLPVFVRRLADLTTVPQVSDSGRMVYGGNWDLWEGFLELWEDEGTDKAGALGGSRFAPLALMNTDSANSGSMGVDGVAVLGGDAYAALGGRHMGALIRVPLPPENRYATNEGTHPELSGSFAVMKAALDGAVILEEVERVDALAVQPSPKGGRALFYRIHGFDGFEWKFLVPGGAARVVGRETSP
jgi:hypothetical protein